MARLLIVALLIVHGLIHALGFAKSFGLAEIQQLSKPVSLPWGVVWALCALAFVAAGVGHAVNAPWWWIVAVPALIASQVAIVAFWSDAKVGTLANLLLIAPIVLSFGSWRFASQLHADLAEIRSSVPSAEPERVQDADLNALPPIVKKWLLRAGVVGRQRARTVSLTQRGEMMKAPGEAWLPFSARQWFVVPEPSFLWTVDVDGGFAMTLSGRDRYFRGKGTMRIELHSLVPVVRAQGPTIDQGALVRYLAEIMWFPSAALEENMHWSSSGKDSAIATIRDGELEVTGTFQFNADGDVVGFTAKRYREAALEDWIIENDPESFRSLDGVRIPTRSTVTWRDTAKESWTWLRLEVTTLRRNQPLSR